MRPQPYGEPSKMDTENDHVEPTRSLFGSKVTAAEPVSEDSTVAVDTADSQPAETETVEAVSTEAVAEPAVEEAVAVEPEPVVTEPEKAQPDVEVADEPGTEVPVEAELGAEDAVVEQSESVEAEMGNEAAVASTEPTEDTTHSVEDTEATKALPEIAKLKAEREKLDQAIQNKQLEERKSVISQIAAVVKLYDIPLLDLFKSLGGVPNPRKGEKAPITHKDDQGNTWTGRGRTPRWLKDKNPDDYRV